MRLVLLAAHRCYHISWKGQKGVQKEFMVNVGKRKASKYFLTAFYRKNFAKLALVSYKEIGHSTSANFTARDWLYAPKKRKTN